MKEKRWRRNEARDSREEKRGNRKKEEQGERRTEEERGEWRTVRGERRKEEDRQRVSRERNSPGHRGFRVCVCGPAVFASVRSWGRGGALPVVSAKGQCALANPTPRANHSFSRLPLAPFTYLLVWLALEGSPL